MHLQNTCSRILCLRSRHFEAREVGHVAHPWLLRYTLGGEIGADFFASSDPGLCGQRLSSSYPSQKKRTQDEFGRTQETSTRFDFVCMRRRDGRNMDKTTSTCMERINWVSYWKTMDQFARVLHRFAGATCELDIKYRRHQELKDEVSSSQTPCADI